MGSASPSRRLRASRFPTEHEWGQRPLLSARLLSCPHPPPPPPAQTDPNPSEAPLASGRPPGRKDTRGAFGKPPAKAGGRSGGPVAIKLFTCPKGISRGRLGSWLPALTLPLAWPASKGFTAFFWLIVGVSVESGNVCRLSKVSLSLWPPAAPQPAPPHTALRSHAHAGRSHARATRSPRSHLALSPAFTPPTRVLSHPTPAGHPPPAHAHHPHSTCSRAHTPLPSVACALASKRPHARWCLGWTDPSRSRSPSHNPSRTRAPTRDTPLHTPAYSYARSLTFPASSPVGETDRQTDTPLHKHAPPRPLVPLQGPGLGPLQRRVAALLPPRLPSPRLFGLLSGYVAEGSFPLVLPIENKVSLYLMVMADVRRIWQMKRPFALKYCSLRRVSLPTHHDPIFFSGCLTRMTNELIFSVHRWEM